MFQRRSNFDLRRLLDGEVEPKFRYTGALKSRINSGSEPALHSLISQLQTDFAFFTTSLQPLRMSPYLRENAASALGPPAKITASPLLSTDPSLMTLFAGLAVCLAHRGRQDRNATSSAETFHSSWRPSPTIEHYILFTRATDVGDLVADMPAQIQPGRICVRLYQLHYKGSGDGVCQRGQRWIRLLEGVAR